MTAAPLRWTFFGCWSLALLLVTWTAQDASAQTGWGDRSFELAPIVNSERRWNGNWIGNSPNNRRWRFGVSATNTDSGVLIQQVEPNSPAGRLGIVPGDVIVCVAGNQVGRVGNQIFDLGEEASRKSDSRGRVSMLMLERSRGRLRPIDVQLQPQRSGLSGSLIVSGNNRLPMDAIMTVRLENQSRPFYQVRNGENSFRLSSFGVGNILFELNYDPTYIFPNDTYSVRAYISSGGRTIYQTQRPTYVITQGNPSNVQLTLTPTRYGTGGGNFIQAGYAPVNAYQQQITAAYQRYLRRSPTVMELAAFERMPDIAARVQRLPTDLMASQEYYSRMGGNTDTWIRTTFTEFVGHAPTAAEMDLWTRRFGELRYSRTEFLNQLAMQARG